MIDSYSLIQHFKQEVKKLENHKIVFDSTKQLIKKYQKTIELLQQLDKLKQEAEKSQQLLAEQIEKMDSLLTQKITTAWHNSKKT